MIWFQAQETSREACGCGLHHGGTTGADPLLHPRQEQDHCSQPQQACIELSGLPAENGSETPLLPPVVMTHTSSARKSTPLPKLR